MKQSIWTILVLLVVTFGCTVQSQPPPSQPQAVQTAPAGDPAAPAAVPAEAPPAAPSGVGPAGTLTAYTGPIFCAGTEDLVLSNAEISAEADGPTVQGSCNLLIENSRITAGGYGLVVQGSGEFHDQGGNQWR